MTNTLTTVLRGEPPATRSSPPSGPDASSTPAATNQSGGAGPHDEYSTVPLHRTRGQKIGKNGDSAVKLKILDQALTEFLAVGYVAFSLASVATELGMTRGNIIYHFPKTRIQLAKILIDSKRLTPAALSKAARDYNRTAFYHDLQEFNK